MGFLNPAALSFAVFFAGLILLYLWERQQRRLDVPSMLLWEAVPEAVARRNRFKPDSLFWLQLAALAALILGLANPYLGGDGDGDAPRRVILVVDLSASMQTIEDGPARLDLAREQAARVIHSAPADSEVAIIGAARAPVVVAPFSAERPALLEALGGLRAKDVATHLEPALAMAQRLAFQSDGQSAIHVFTDVPRDTVGERWRDGANWWPAGSRADNLAIAAVETTQGILQYSQPTGARISIYNFGDGEKHGALAVRVAGELVAQELFTAQPASARSFHVPRIESSGLLEASLQSDDALALDNHWRTWLPPFRPVRIALVDATPDLAAALARLDAATAAIEVEAMTNDRAAELSAFDLSIYHRHVPKRWPATAILLIAPHSDVVSGRALGEVHDAAVVDWRDDHPVLRGLEPHLLHPFTRLTQLAAVPWGEAVLTAQAAGASGREVPFLVVGELGEPTARRVAILAADLEGEAFLASDREPLLLLLVNLIDWLAEGRHQPGGGAVSVVRTGESKAVDNPPGGVVEVVDPRGNRSELRGDDPFLDFDYAGIYRLRAPGGGESTVLANFQDAAESDVGRPATRPHAAGSSAARRGEPGAERGLSPWLYAAAALLLLAEWRAAARTDDHG